MDAIEITVVDMHTAGEPVRIVVAGYPTLAGDTILARRRAALEEHDHLRRALMHEPRGHRDMYGVILTPPTRQEAVASVLFMHHDGYSTMCGHATIALGRFLVERGLVEAQSPVTRFAIEAPCGLVSLAVEVGEGGVGAVSFDSVPAFVAALDIDVEVPGHGRVVTDIAYGGAFYAILPSSAMGLDFFETPVEDLRRAAGDLTDAIRATRAIRHPHEPDLGFLYGTILTDGAAADADSFNLCVFAERQVDRSPTGSGVTARLALDHARGLIGPGIGRIFRGISGEPFLGAVVGPVPDYAVPAVSVRVAGRAHTAGEARFLLAPDDPLRFGLALPPTFGVLTSPDARRT